MKQKTSISLEEETIAKLDKIAKQEKRSRSQIVNMMLEAALSKLSK